MSSCEEVCVPSFRQCLGRPLSGHQGPFCSEVGGAGLPLAVSGLTHTTMWKGRTVANWSHRALFGPRMDLSLMSERMLFHITPREHSLLRATLLQKDLTSPAVLLVDTEQQGEKLSLPEGQTVPTLGFWFPKPLC